MRHELAEDRQGHGLVAGPADLQRADGCRGVGKTARLVRNRPTSRARVDGRLQLAIGFQQQLSEKTVATRPLLAETSWR